MYVAKYFKHFMCNLRDHYYSLSVHIRNSSTEQKQCAFKYLLSAALSCAFSFSRFVTLYDKLLNILILE
jgi:hypothetical protein